MSNPNRGRDKSDTTSTQLFAVSVSLHCIFWGLLSRDEQQIKGWKHAIPARDPGDFDILARLLSIAARFVRNDIDENVDWGDNGLQEAGLSCCAEVV
jgi:hypothetical protein